MPEEWKDIEGFEGLYMVSSHGRVARIMSPKRTAFGHLRACLTRHSKHTMIFVHRLVLTAFVGPCPPGMEARHTPDRTPDNNRLDNLKWGTPKENNADMVRDGTRIRGSKFWKTKLSERDVKNVFRRFATGESKSDLAQYYGVTRSGIHNILIRRCWSHVDIPIVHLETAETLLGGRQ